MTNEEREKINKICLLIAELKAKDDYERISLEMEALTIKRADGGYEHYFPRKWNKGNGAVK